MTVVNQVVVEVLNIVARGLDGTQTTTDSTPAETSIPPATSSPSSQNSGGSPASQSPLLFFVALGFGVVFTNLWYV
jgi:hypothetical protein